MPPFSAIIALHSVGARAPHATPRALVAPALATRRRPAAHRARCKPFGLPRASRAQRSSRRLGRASARIIIQPLDASASARASPGADARQRTLTSTTAPRPRAPPSCIPALRCPSSEGARLLSAAGPRRRRPAPDGHDRTVFGGPARRDSRVDLASR